MRHFLLAILLSAALLANPCDQVERVDPASGLRLTCSIEKAAETNADLASRQPNPCHDCERDTLNLKLTTLNVLTVEFAVTVGMLLPNGSKYSRTLTLGVPYIGLYQHEIPPVGISSSARVSIPRIAQVVFVQVDELQTAASAGFK